MTFDRRLANITGSARGLYCSSSQKLTKKALHEITGVKPILILFLSFDSQQRPNSTSLLHHLTPRHWWRTFLGTYHAIFKCSVGYFKEVLQAIF